MPPESPVLVPLITTSHTQDTADSRPAPWTGAPRARHSSANRSARSAVRLTIKMFFGPASSKAGITPFTAPPAPINKMRAPANDQPAPAVMSLTSPFPSVLSATIWPSSSRMRKFAAPAHCALKETTSASSKARVLNGRVTLRPSPPCAKKWATHRSNSSWETSSAR